MEWFSRFLSAACATAVLACTGALAQSYDLQPLQAFRGEWSLNEAATTGLRYAPAQDGPPLDALAFPVARKLSISTAPNEVLVAKDSGPPEVYRFDGTDSQVRDLRTNVPLLPKYRFTFVAGMMALTATTPRGQAMQVITDLYSLSEWNVLKVERQFSMVTPESLRAPSAGHEFPQAFIYRRENSQRASEAVVLDGHVSPISVRRE